MDGRVTAGIILGGGRIDGEYARHTGVTVKALVPWNGRVVLDNVVDAARGVEGLERLVVVGPQQIAPRLNGCEFVPEESSVLTNVLAGLRQLGSSGGRVLLLASDMPFVTTGSLEDFIERSAPNFEIALPVVSRQKLECTFPVETGLHTYVSLREGEFTMGGALLIDSTVMQQNRELLERLFQARKSLWSLAGLLGPAALFAYVTKTLTTQQIEKRVCHLTHMRAAAVHSCAAELAFDIDTVADYQAALLNCRPA